MCYLVEVGKRGRSRVAKFSKSIKKKLELEIVYLEVAKLLVEKNPEQISFSLIAKKSKVPRTTLYYYFNSEIQRLIIESVRNTMREFMQVVETSPEGAESKFTTWIEMQKCKFGHAIKLVSKSPWILSLYFRYCRHPGYVGDEIRRMETVYLQVVERDWIKFHNTGSDERHRHLIAHFKIGILWGIIGTDNIWKGDEQALLDACLKYFSFMEQEALA
jgi:AcrR family transcriptional regulator